jgi:hypothetical protein
MRYVSIFQSLPSFSGRVNLRFHFHHHTFSYVILQPESALGRQLYILVVSALFSVALDAFYTYYSSSFQSQQSQSHITQSC